MISWKDFADTRKDKRKRNKKYTEQLIQKMGYSHIKINDNQFTINHNDILAHITLTTGKFIVVHPERVQGRGIKNLIYYLSTHKRVK